MAWQRIGNLPLRRKLLGAFGIILLITILLSAASLRAAQNNERANEAVLHTQNVITTLGETLIALYGMRTNFSSYMLTGQDTWLAPYETSRDQALAKLESVSSLTVDNPAQQERLAAMDQLMTTWATDIVDPALAIRRVSTPDDPATDPLTTSAIQQSRDQFRQIQGVIETAIGEEESLLFARTGEAQRETLDLRRILVFGTGAALLAGVTLAWLIARDIADRVGRLTAVAQEISGGDFSQRLRFIRQDEIGRAATAFDQMADNLQSTMHQLEATARQAQTERRRTGAILNTIADGILTFRADGTVTESNPAAEIMFGREEEEFRGLPIDELLRCDPGCRDLATTLQTILPQDDSSQGVVQTVLGYRKDGSVFPLEIVVSAMVDGELQYVGATRDITERHEAERRLQAQMREAHRTRGIANAVLDAAVEGMILISPDLRITAMNQRFAELFAVTIVDVINRSIKDFGSHLDQRIEEAERFRTMLYGSVRNNADRIEDTFVQAWPLRRELEMISMPVRTRDGQPVGRVYSFRDVTREREVDRMKSEFVSMVSHELRTPLTSIKGYVDLLLEGEVGELSPDQHEFLEIVGSNAERLVSLINDILDISRIEAGRVTLSIVPVDVHALLERLAVSFRPQMEAKRQHLRLEIEPRLPLVRGDGERLTQVFANLISNAHKYTPAGGEIAIRSDSDDTKVRISVTDTGIGLSPEEQAQLFTRFYRAQNRTTQEVGGTGLGLSITRSLVELHGGAISVTSTPGAGSTFIVAIPRAVEEAVALPADPGASKVDGRILIVEDEPDIARLIRRYLERAGYEVQVAADAATALQIAREVPLDLITLDVMLPDTDGLTLLEWLKSDSQTSRIPVIMLSMVADEGKSQALGAVEYLTKPVREDALLHRINLLLADDRGGTILIADDDEEIRHLLVRQVTRAGHRALEARNGEEAVRIAMEENLDAVLLDIRMPGMDDVRALQAIRDVCPAGQLPIIMMTASPGAADATQDILSTLGIADLLQKPIPAEDLARSIAVSLRHKREGPHEHR